MRLRKLVSDVCARAEQGRLIVFSHFGHLSKFERMRFGRKQLVATTAVQHTQRIREEEDVVEEDETPKTRVHVAIRIGV